MINCIIIDDEPLALELVEGFIKDVPYLKLIGTYTSPQDALVPLREESIDLLFLDVNMPDLSGIQFLKSLPNPPAVIFTTAYDQYAIQGFELNALDYLLKPFSFDRFLRATNKAHEVITSKNSQKALGEHNYIFVKVEHNVLKIKLSDIFYIEGYKDYLKIFTGDEKPIFTLKSMKSMDQMLQDKGFIRVHRSYIISIDKIDSLRNGRIKISDKTIPLGEHYKADFEEKVLKGRL